MLPVLLGFGQRCPKCGQKSSPKVGQGKWEVMGLWNGSINKCTDCGTLIRVGFVSDEVLAKDDAEQFLKAREKYLNSK